MVGVTNDQQFNLETFAAEHGTTDDIRDGIELNPPEDGHLRRVNDIHDYWRGLEARADGYYNSQSMVPPGSFTVVLNPSEPHVEFGWPNESRLKAGVWLSGKDGIASVKPPVPVAIDDDHLRFAAEACLLAAKQIVPKEDVVAIRTSQHETLSVGVTSEAYDYQEELFNGGGFGGMPPREGADTRHGFFHIRKMGTPFNVYTHAEAPRLGLEELRVDIPERWSA
ncbi:hypothetical protein SAMN05421809_3653 [Natronorubrum daqingense]|uniref:Uncharacterized protein n=1 Tax=Natronorubrum daqingense TaxID=588898 RepID=A0A1N7G110_9EURY|nr:hypothetical protein BB347_18185 [Natronorubrum daqingense]SIS06293.1 hypothetical protein SAMN05421809_3653 [Natronorubrum daqingense]